MESNIVLILVGVFIGYLVIHYNSKVKLLAVIKNSQLVKDLKELGYNEIESKHLIGHHQGYQTGFYFYLDNRAKVLGYATISCKIPFVKAKDGAKKIAEFKNKYKSKKFIIDSPNGFCKELDYDFMKKSTGTDMTTIFDAMVSAAQKERFELLK
ncbi:MAG TPA: hypothetical protein VIM65_09945 [Cyclobacteriaceae bacterium]